MKFLIIVCLIFSSCSTVNKSRLYSGIALGLIGGFVGSEIARKTSPNPESVNTNQLISMSAGIGAGAVVGVYLGEWMYKDDPENFKGKDIMLSPPRLNSQGQVEIEGNLINLSDLQVVNSSGEKYEIKASNELPENLQDKVYKQIIIKHKIPTQSLQLPDGRTVIVDETEAIEHKFVR